jgi:hypothetical protein
MFLCLTVSTRGKVWWPFEIVIQNRLNVRRSYKPGNDLTAFASRLPRLLLQINPTTGRATAVSHASRGSKHGQIYERILEAYKTQVHLSRNHLQWRHGSLLAIPFLVLK